MNRYELRRQFGRNPDIVAVLVWATQQALRGWGKTHPDRKRQRTTKLRNLSMWRARELKRAL